MPLKQHGRVCGTRFFSEGCSCTYNTVRTVWMNRFWSYYVVITLPAIQDRHQFSWKSNISTQTKLQQANSPEQNANASIRHHGLYVSVIFLMWIFYSLWKSTTSLIIEFWTLLYKDLEMKIKEIYPYQCFTHFSGILSQLLTVNAECCCCCA